MEKDCRVSARMDPSDLSPRADKKFQLRNGISQKEKSYLAAIDFEKVWVKKSRCRRKNQYFAFQILSFLCQNAFQIYNWVLRCDIFRLRRAMPSRLQLGHPVLQKYFAEMDKWLFENTKNRRPHNVALFWSPGVLWYGMSINMAINSIRFRLSEAERCWYSWSSVGF